MKWPGGDIRWMPVWSWKEISSGMAIFGQQEADVTERYDRWGGIPRFVLQQTTKPFQDWLDRAISGCSISTLKNSFFSITADAFISHKLFHVTVGEGFSQGPIEIVEGYVLDSLIFEYAVSTERDVIDFLTASCSKYDIECLRRKVLAKQDSIEDARQRRHDWEPHAVFSGLQAMSPPFCSCPNSPSNPRRGISQWDYTKSPRWGLRMGQEVKIRQPDCMCQFIYISVSHVPKTPSQISRGSACTVRHALRHRSCGGLHSLGIIWQCLCHDCRRVCWWPFRRESLLGMPSKEGRKEILLMRATTKVDWHVNVWSEQISGPQIYQGKQWCTC